MSYEIEYQKIAFSFDAGNACRQAFKDLPDGERFAPYCETAPCVVTFCEHGSNNTYNRDSDKRARYWSLQYVGEVSSVMLDFIVASVYAESGMLKPKNRDVTAEAYITAARKLIKNAQPLTRLQGIMSTNVLFRINDYSAERADSNPWWQKAMREGRVQKDYYSESCNMLEVSFADINQLICDLYTIAQISCGQCSSKGDFKRDIHYYEIERALNAISGQSSLEMFAA